MFYICSLSGESQQVRQKPRFSAPFSRLSALRNLCSQMALAHPRSLNAKRRNPVNQSSEDKPRTALVLAGGMGLGAYHGGAYEALLRANSCNLDWLAGSSVGAINAALIAGNSPDRAVERLREFWSEPNAWQPRMQLPFFSLRYTQNWI